MTTKRLVPLLSVVICAALALSACTSTTAAGSAPPPTVSPLAEYMDSVFGAGNSDVQAAQQKQIEMLIAACMKKEGFEYTAASPENVGSGVTSLDIDHQESEEDAAANGYGISVTSVATDQPGVTTYDDPNAAYVATLTDGEKTAFYATLYGNKTASSGTTGGVVEYDWKTAGCQGAAQHEVTADQDPSSDPEFADLMSAMSTLYQQEDSDPGAVAANAAWSDCMATAGHTGLKNKQDAFESIITKMNTLSAGPNVEAPNESEHHDVDPAALVALQKEEKETAVADAHCAISLGYQAALAEVRNRLETQFVADHKPALEALKAKYGAHAE